MKTRLLLRLCFLLLLGLTEIKGYSQCASGAVTIDTIVTRPLCYGTSTGSIQVNIVGGQAPFTYSLYSDTIPDQSFSTNVNSHTFSNLPPGTYLVATQVTLGVGFTFCTAGPISISSPSEILIGGNIIPPLCNGGNDGSIDATVSGGTPPYDYSWNTTPISNAQDISGLTVGTYTLTVTDDNGCIQTQDFTITEPTVLSGSGSVTDVSCNGGSDGAIDLSPAGGTPPYSFSWDNGASSEDISGLTDGNFTVTIIDDNGCEQIIPFTISEPAAISISGTPADVSCNGGADGAVDITVAGGVAPYSYSWDNGAGSEDINGLPAGDYTVTVTDDNGCTANALFTVSEPAALTLTDALSHVLCNGGSTGAIDLTVNGGTLPYSYSWDNGATSEDINGLPEGDYTVTVTDGNGCTQNATYTINEPPVLTLNGSPVDASCLGVNDGAIDLTVNGGTPGYTYSWDNGASSEDLSGLAGGSYTVTVTDANGCEETATYDVVQPPALTLTENITHVDCNGNGNGAIDLTVAGGSLPYTYSWNTTPVSNSQDLAGLDGGSYTVTVTDNNGCSQDATYNVDEPTPLTLSDTPTDVTPCNGDSNGAIDLTVNGGTAPYSFNWSNGASSEDLSGITAGNYSVTVTDANGCTQNANINIDEPPAITITDLTDHVNCNGDSDGSIDITVNNGVAPLSFLWSNGATSEDVSGLAAGNYSVTVTDATGCDQTANYTINEPAVITLNGNPTDASCLGVNDGAIDLTVNGGTPGYTYSWDNGASSEDLSGLAGGSYTATVTDANGCQEVATYNVVQPPALTLTENITHVDCNGNGNGAIDLTVAGGSLPYTYSWNTAPVSNSQDLAGLDGGSYTVTVTDNNGCSQNATYNVDEPAPLTLSDTPTDVTCNGGNDGAIDLTVNGGTAPYSFNWSNGASSEDLSGITAGNYSVTVTDVNGCTQNANINIAEPPAITITDLIDHVNCNGDSDGSIDITVNNGVAPLSFLWSNGATSEDVSGLAAGNYSVTVTDATGCDQTANYTINEPAVLTVSGNATNILCNSGTTGSIDLIVNGGTAPYTYAWDNGAITQDISGLATGSYSVTVTDDNGCEQTANFDITEPSPIDIDPSVTHILCNGGSNGAIDVTVTGGTAPYSYSWDNGTTSEDLSGLGAATYILTVTDAAGCDQVANIPVNEPAPLTINDNNTDASCTGLDNGIIDITINGGTAPYSYSWDNGATSEDLSNLAGGSYAVTVTDANGCTQNASYNIAQPATINLNGAETDLICNGTTIGAIDLTIVGGTSPYTINWSNGETTEDVNNLIGGNYTVNVTDNNGCTQNAAFTIDEPAAMSITETITNALCGGVNDGAIDIEVAGGTAPYSYAWSNGASSQDISGLADGPYNVTVTDANTCTQNVNYNVTVTLNFNLTIVISTPLCNGNTNGIIDVANVTGGTAPYTYSFEGGAYGATNVFNNLGAGSYAISVRDASGCQQDSIVEVTEPAVLDLGATFDSPICSYGNNGEVTLSATGGTPVYQFSDNKLTYSNQNTYNGLNPGTYRFYMLDGNGCIDSVDATLNAFPIVNISDIDATVKHLTCNNVNEGEIKLSNITGGTAPFTFSLNGGTPKVTPEFPFLPAGTHVITITDANGCNYDYDTVISQPQRIQFSLDILKVETCDNSDGVFALSTISGGLAPFSYSYSFNNQPVIPFAGDTVKFSGLPSNLYTVQVFDNNVANCSSISSIALPKKPGPIPYIEISDVLCPDGSNGMVIIDSLEGGVANFNITLTDTSGYLSTLTNVVRNDSVAFDNLIPHLYNMTIEDQECTYETNLFYILNQDSSEIGIVHYDTVFVDSLRINEPSPIGDTITVTNTDRHNQTGSATIYDFYGGTPGYFYSLDNVSFQPVLNDSVVMNNLDVGLYYLYVRDANGCPFIDTFYIGADLYIPNLISPNGDNHNDVFEIIALPKNSELRIFNRWGSRVYFSKNYDNLWAGSNEPDGVYYFELLLPNFKVYKGWVEIIR